ncbi:olfactory receptor 63, partial [Danaus plexippus plexippus]
ISQSHSYTLTNRRISLKYPYDTSVSPAYELTYMHQTLSIMIGAVLNISKDSLVTTLLAQTRCRLGLVGLALTTVCSGLLPEKWGRKSLQNPEISVLMGNVLEEATAKDIKNCGKMLDTPAMKKAIVLEQKMLEVQKEKQKPVKYKEDIIMGLIVQNINFSLRFSLTALKIAGLWAPDGMQTRKKALYYCYTFVLLMFLLGTFIILQMIDLYLIWGNLSLMTGTALVLFTNISQVTKIINLLARRKHIEFLIKDTNDGLEVMTSSRARELIKSCDHETRNQQVIFLLVTFVTTVGWATITDKNGLPLPAWYPYDTSVSPAYELTYTHQTLSIMIVAVLNISKDSLVTTLLAQTRCRLGLVGLALTTVCSDLVPEEDNTYSGGYSNKLFTAQQEMIAKNRLRICVQQHQRALRAAKILQECFSVPTFAQFSVSLIIICVTAFQVLSSEELARRAYEMPWYMCSVSVRRSIQIMMIRCHRIVKFTAGGFTTLSLATFTAVIKLSYSMLTLLQQVNEKI